MVMGFVEEGFIGVEEVVVEGGGSGDGVPEMDIVDVEV